MGNRNREDWQALFGRFFDTAGADAAAEDVRTGERLLDAFPAPKPSDELIEYINAQMVARRTRKRRLAHLSRALTAVAAVIVVAALALLGHGPAPRHTTHVSYASIIPASVWESDDVNADDADLMYFHSEIRRIEAQMEALESSGDDFGPAEDVEEIEMELMQIETEFWKG
ncbi:MAG: hypothetical protein JW741_04855 [Sedimentisphaerales bacterium]|nr:hypothetical protein [Sedimentisphaerales bacterium]